MCIAFFVVDKEVGSYIDLLIVSKVVFECYQQINQLIAVHICFSHGLAIRFRVIDERTQGDRGSNMRFHFDCSLRWCHGRTLFPIPLHRSRGAPWPPCG